LNEMIWKVGFHNTKAKNILSVAELLHTNYEDDIPPTAQEMIDVLPGVGYVPYLYTDSKNDSN